MRSSSKTPITFFVDNKKVKSTPLHTYIYIDMMEYDLRQADAP